MEFINHLGYNSVVILTFFFISFVALILNYITKGKSNNVLFSSYKSSLLKPLTYVRLVTHIFGHADWNHFMNNFLYILLIGPMIEEKYGSKNLTIMIIILSSFVNITTGKVPITLILICIFYVVNEIISGIFKKDNISHMGHLIGALCGFIFGFYVFK